jgi:YbbR domain-containing protein
MNGRLKKHSLKFISVFLSIFMWVYVLNSEKVKFEKTVMLEYVLPPEMMFADRPPQEVIFLIEGPRAFVKSVTEREDRLVIDLNRNHRDSLKKSLNFSVDINPAQLNLPFGMVVERVLPRKIGIKLERRAGKIVPLKIQFIGQLPEKLSLTDVELEPDEVEIYGPRSLVAKINHVATKPVDLETLVGNDEILVDPQLTDERLSVITGTDFKLRYQLKAASSNLTLKDLPIKILSHARTIRSDVKRAQIKLLVPEKILKNRSNISSSIQVWVDIPQDAKGRMEVPLKVVLPPGIHLLEITPKTIIVNVQ